MVNIMRQKLNIFVQLLLITNHEFAINTVVKFSKAEQSRSE